MASKNRPRAISLTAHSPRQLAARAFIALLVAFAFLSLALSRSNPQFLSQIRNQLAETLAPVVEIAASPAKGMARAGDWFASLATLQANTATLKSTQAELSRWQTAARALEAENKDLRALLKVAAQPKLNYITAHVVGDSASPYVHSALISGGQEDGVQKDNAVLNEKGLLGRVIEQGKSHSRVLLLTDINSRVPVIGELSRERSILTGDNTSAVSLTFAPSHTALRVGERIVTSGDGGIFPAGIPVAVVTSVNENGIKAAPLADWKQSEFVSVVNYEF